MTKIRQQLDLNKFIKLMHHTWFRAVGGHGSMVIMGNDIRNGLSFRAICFDFRSTSVGSLVIVLLVLMSLPFNPIYLILYTLGPSSNVSAIICPLNWLTDLPKSWGTIWFDKFWIWNACNDRKWKVCKLKNSGNHFRKTYYGWIFTP